MSMKKEVKRNFEQQLELHFMNVKKDLKDVVCNEEGIKQGINVDKEYFYVRIDKDIYDLIKDEDGKYAGLTVDVRDTVTEYLDGNRGIIVYGYGNRMLYPISIYALDEIKINN